jgi:hypothetical protein
LLNNRFAIWLCCIARSSLAILRQPIAKQAMPFGDQNLLNNCLAIWLCRIARSLLAILRQPIAKQVMPFGDRLSLKKLRRFGYVLSLNICWQLGDEQSLSVRKLFVITYR